MWEKLLTLEYGCRFNIELKFIVSLIKADLLARYGGVAPKMAEEAHSQVIDQVSYLKNWNLSLGFIGISLNDIFQWFKP